MLFEKVKEIVANQLNVDADKITMETNLMEDLKADSLDIVELIMDLENEFDLQIPDEDLPKVTTISDIIKYIEAHR